MGKVGFQRLRSTSRLFDSCKDLGNRFKRFLERSLRNFSVEVKIPHEYLGASSYGAWAIDPRDIGPQSVVYSFGVGEDVSWDVMMIERFCVQIHALRPDSQIDRMGAAANAPFIICISLLWSRSKRRHAALCLAP